MSLGSRASTFRIWNRYNCWSLMILNKGSCEIQYLGNFSRKVFWGDSAIKLFFLAHHTSRGHPQSAVWFLNVPFSRKLLVKSNKYCVIDYSTSWIPLSQARQPFPLLWPLTKCSFLFRNIQSHIPMYLLFKN